MKNQAKLLMAATVSLLMVTACRKDDPIPHPTTPVALGPYQNGVLISNEGNFGTPNASLSYVPNDLSKIENNIYNTANGGALLGDILQSVYSEDQRSYMVINNSNRVVIADRYTMKKTGEITAELNSPRYLTTASGNIFVTNDTYQGAKYVSIYNADNYAHKKSITMPDAAERILAFNNNVFVQNASFGEGNKITVINAKTTSVTNTITIPAGKLQNIATDGVALYALTNDGASSAILQYSSTGSLIKTITMPSTAKAQNLVVYKDNLYYTAGKGVYQMKTSATSAPAQPLFSIASNSTFGLFYGFNVLNDKIFASDALGFTAPSKVYIYNLNGTLQKEFTAGMGTNGFYEN